MAIFFIINLSSFSTSYNFRVVCLYYTIMIPSWKIQIVRKIILLRTVCIFGQFCKLELVGAQPLHLADARPFYRLKAPLGLSLLHFVSQTRTCRSETPPFCLRKNVLSLKHPAGVFVASANANLSGRGPSILLSQDRSVACTPHWGMHCWTSFNKREFDTLYLSRILLKPFCKAWFIENNEFI